MDFLRIRKREQKKHQRGKQDAEDYATQYQCRLGIFSARCDHINKEHATQVAGIRAEGEKKYIMAASPDTMQKVAPKAEPPEIPSVYGSAKGLRRIPWKMHPLTASPMPTSNPRKIHGMRIFHKIVVAMFPAPGCKSSFIISPEASLLPPSKSATNNSYRQYPYQ